MPYPRPTLTALRQQVKTDIVSGLPPGATALLRYSNLGILGDALAGLACYALAYGIDTLYHHYRPPLKPQQPIVPR